MVDVHSKQCWAGRHVPAHEVFTSHILFLDSRLCVLNMGIPWLTLPTIMGKCTLLVFLG